MRNRLPAFTALVSLVAGLSAAAAQEHPAGIQTNGACSPIVIDTDGDVEINVACPIELTAEQLAELIAAIREPGGVQGDLIDRIERLAGQLGVQRTAVQNFLEILGERSVEPDELDARLREIAQRHLQLLTDLRTFRSEDPEVVRLKEQAAQAIEDGDYDRAEALLVEAEEADLRAARRAQEIADQRFLSAAETRAERGELRLTRLDYLGAAEAFRTAADLVPEDAQDERGTYLLRQANALYRHGDERGDNAALVQAIGVHRQALEALPRERVPLHWAMTQNNLGAALRTLGERERGTARLEEAVAAYRAALEERTRERVPLAWATTQNNLGNALWNLGERERGTARLEEAVAAYRAALEERTRERVPLDWAMTQTNLGLALEALGQAEDNTARLEEAVMAYRAALEVVEAGNATYYADMARRNLRRAEALLQDRLAEN
jgi:tetratricopeptide (TPR) repeat protein